MCALANKTAPARSTPPAENTRPAEKMTGPSEKMIGPPAKMTFEQFVREYEDVEGRWELHDGVPVRKHDPARGQSEKIRHVKVKLNITLALREAVRQPLPDDHQCHVLMDGVTVPIDDTYGYEPDALVYCGDEVDDDDLAVPSPLIIVEVLSPGTRGIDLTDKLEAYFTLESVQHYLVLDPANKFVMHYQRHEDDQHKNGRLLQIYHDGALTLTPPGLVLDVAELFADLRS